MFSRAALFVIPMCVACSSADADLQIVMLGQEPPTVATSHARVDRVVLDACRDGADDGVVTIGADVDLLATVPQAFVLPGGRWCGFGVVFQSDTTGTGSLAVQGSTSDGGSLDVAIDPGLVPVKQEFQVDGDEWVLVLDSSRFLKPVADATVAPVIAPTDADAATMAAGLPAAWWFGTVPEARDVTYVDLWPFPDITFTLGIGDVDIGTGCNGGGTLSRDLDRDGILDDKDPDEDGDGISNSKDPDRDGDGTANASDPTPDDGSSGGTKDKGTTDGGTTDGSTTDGSSTDGSTTDGSSTDGSSGSNDFCGACNGCISDVFDPGCGCGGSGPFSCNSAPTASWWPATMLMLIAGRRRRADR